MSMSYEYDQWWCDCDGATSVVGDNALECIECGALWQWSEQNGWQKREAFEILTRRKLSGAT